MLNRLHDCFTNCTISLNNVQFIYLRSNVQHTTEYNSGIDINPIKQEPYQFFTKIIYFCFGWWWLLVECILEPFDNSIEAILDTYINRLSILSRFISWIVFVNLNYYIFWCTELDIPLYAIEHVIYSIVWFLCICLIVV